MAYNIFEYLSYVLNMTIRQYYMFHIELVRNTLIFWVAFNFKVQFQFQSSRYLKRSLNNAYKQFIVSEKLSRNKLCRMKGMFVWQNAAHKMTKPKVHYTLWAIANECFVLPLFIRLWCLSQNALFNGRENLIIMFCYMILLLLNIL